MRSRYNFSDAFIMARGLNGKYTNLSDFNIGNVVENEFPSTAKYLIVVCGGKKTALKLHGYYAEISLSDLLNIASIRENTGFVSSIRNKIGKEDAKLSDDILAILASRKINNTVEGYIERIGNSNMFCFKKRKVIKGKEAFPVLAKAEFISLD